MQPIPGPQKKKKKNNKASPSKSFTDFPHFVPITFSIKSSHIVIGEFSLNWKNIGGTFLFFFLLLLCCFDYALICVN